MRILLISWEYPPYVVGGMGKHVAELVPALEKLNQKGGELRIDILTTRYGGHRAVEKVDESTTVYRVQLPAVEPFDHYNSVIANNHLLADKARKLARSDAYDLIHCHDWLTITAGNILKHEWKVPLLLTVHATERGRHQGHLPSDTSRQIHQVEWQGCYEAWKVIACSDYMRGELERYFGVPQDKIVTIPNGVERRLLHSCSHEEAEALRKRHAPNGENLLFFVGRITPEKGLQVLVRAMAQLLPKYPKTRLLAAGKNSEQLLSLADEMGVAHACDFLGYISNKERDHLFQAADAAILPSLYEPFGIVALEAMALGCNVIASDVGGLGEVVQHEHNGLTVLPNDAQSIAWAVDRLLADPAAAAERRAVAQNEVATRYNWNSIAEKTVMLYGEIINARQQIVWE